MAGPPTLRMSVVQLARMEISSDTEPSFFLLQTQGRGRQGRADESNVSMHSLIIIIKRRSGINPISPTVIDRD